jgi:hypothetical protein
MDLRVIAILFILLLIIMLAVIIYVGVVVGKISKAERAARARLEDQQYKEHISRLRHRDLEAFQKELNIMRAKKGQRGLPKETLKKIQYNLMYSIDE